jgi:DNA-directed RNA polymerase subunit RPC12/RpoP
MTWNDGDYAEELSKDENEGYYCPWCKKETDIWFDRTIVYLSDDIEIGMKDRCTKCGKATDEEPPDDTSEFKNDIGEAENDGG